jgi:endonuclease G
MDPRSPPERGKAMNTSLLIFPGYLNARDINELSAAAVGSGLCNFTDRARRTAGIAAGFVARIRRSNDSIDEFDQELMECNRHERLLDGSVPLTIFLDNCASVLRIRQLAQCEIFERHSNRIGNQASGVAQRPGRRPGEVPNLQSIVGRDEMLDFVFLGDGARVGRSVARILVPRFENNTPKQLSAAEPWVMQGTAWIIAKDRMLTNHHVINARATGEQPAAESDLLVQARSAEIEFDADGPRSNIVHTRVGKLLAWDVALDYALLDVPTADRAPLVLTADAVRFGPASWLPVNIIQHPRGGYKKIGIRSNLVTATTDTEVRYFTDTDIGSSGSPVCNDDWQVIALHCGSYQVSDVSFRGSTSAYVNFGSQIAAILQDLNHKKPGILRTAGASHVP